MKIFRCHCGQRVFFDNTECGVCGTQLGFDPATLTMLSVEQTGDGHYVSDDGRTFRHCRNFHEHRVCNWLLPAGSENFYCIGCERTDVIPSLAVPGNWLFWSRLEAAKRRLLYTLLSLGLPLSGPGGQRPLRFKFMEDNRQNPAVLESFVSTGHFEGTITINVVEADNVARNAAREQMQERYRTLLGHFRHEGGHYFFETLVLSQGETDNFRRLFGDEREDYAKSIEAYYREGISGDWASHFVSAYAGSHAHEDWAETFAHYLHIVDALETAANAGLVVTTETAAPRWIVEWMELAITMNELNRSLGLDDPYPFSLSQPVIDKLSFIDRLVRPQAAPEVVPLG